MDETTKKDVCLYNRDSTACNYGVYHGVIGFLASMGFIVGEYLFEQMSSVKTRKRFVMADIAFSGKQNKTKKTSHFYLFFAQLNSFFFIYTINTGVWSFLSLCGFQYISKQWSKSDDPPLGVGTGNLTAAIFFLFLLIFTWVFLQMI